MAQVTVCETFNRHDTGEQRASLMQSSGSFTARRWIGARVMGFGL